MKLAVLAGAIIIAGFLCGGVYTATGQGTGGAIVVNRFTGNGWYCGASNCFRLIWREPTAN